MVGRVDEMPADGDEYQDDGDFYEDDDAVDDGGFRSALYQQQGKKQ